MASAYHDLVSSIMDAAQDLRRECASGTIDVEELTFGEMALRRVARLYSDHNGYVTDDAVMKMWGLDWRITPEEQAELDALSAQ